MPEDMRSTCELSKTLTFREERKRMSQDSCIPQRVDFQLATGSAEVTWRLPIHMTPNDCPQMCTIQ